MSTPLKTRLKSWLTGPKPCHTYQVRTCWVLASLPLHLVASCRHIAQRRGDALGVTMGEVIQVGLEELARRDAKAWWVQYCYTS